MHKFYDGNKVVEIPTAIEELTPEQYMYFITLASLFAASASMSETALRVRWLSYLAGLGPLDFTLFLSERKKLFLEALPMTDNFFHRGADGKLLPHFDTPVNLLPEIEGYHGPGDMLDGITFGEFTECSSVIRAISENPAADAMEAYGHIARVLYKIPKEKEIPEILYFHAPTLFRNVLKLIESDPIEINGEKIDFRIIFQSSKTGNNYDDKTGWVGITFEVASSGVFGGVKDVENADFWMVLLYLYRCKFEYLHSKRKGR
ncbi:MAG: hypothetical protein J1E95_08620 [Muribaculaceae bacterium]|nr:hypothetical protein [Muribaculaceae bacterium]